MVNEVVCGLYDEVIHYKSLYTPFRKVVSNHCHGGFKLTCYIKFFLCARKFEPSSLPYKAFPPTPTHH